MELERGLVVKSIAGRDKGSFLTVISSTDDDCLLCDGKARPLSRPKRKKHKHLCKTRTVLSESQLLNDAGIRKALREFA